MSIFTPDEVKSLWKRQFGPWEVDPNTGFPIMFHPYTCGNRNDGNHREFGGDLGILVPTVNGWICPCCDYKQDWAHDMDKDNNND